MKAIVIKLILAVAIVGLLLVSCDNTPNLPPKSVEENSLDELVASFPKNISPQGLQNLLTMRDFFLGKSEQITTLTEPDAYCPSPVCRSVEIISYECIEHFLCWGTTILSAPWPASQLVSYSFCHWLETTCDPVYREVTRCCDYQYHQGYYGDWWCSEQRCWNE